MSDRNTIKQQAEELTRNIMRDGVLLRIEVSDGLYDIKLHPDLQPLHDLQASLTASTRDAKSQEISCSSQLY